MFETLNICEQSENSKITVHYLKTIGENCSLLVRKRYTTKRPPTDIEKIKLLLPPKLSSYCFKENDNSDQKTLEPCKAANNQIDEYILILTDNNLVNELQREVYSPQSENCLKRKRPSMEYETDSDHQVHNKQTGKNHIFYIFINNVPH
jgi:hypothetical protein